MSLRDSNCAGFYHWPPIWIGDSAETIEAAHSVDPNAVVTTHTLSCGVVAKISIKGVFAFDFTHWPPGASQTTGNWEVAVLARMRFMNLVLACLYSTVFRDNRKTLQKMFIDLGTYTFARDFDVHPFHLGCDMRQAAVIQENEHQHSKVRPWQDVLTLEILHKSISLAEGALQEEGNDAATLAELLLHAFHLNDSGKYEASHISAWTVAERCINHIWLSRLDDKEREYSNSSAESQEKFINAIRRQKLTGRDFTASVVSEVLSLEGLLPFEQYKLATRVRQTRNEWLHKLRPITNQDSAAAIQLARFLLRRSNILDVDIPFCVIGSVPIALVSKDDKMA